MRWRAFLTMLLVGWCAACGSGSNTQGDPHAQLVKVQRGSAEQTNTSITDIAIQLYRPLRQPRDCATTPTVTSFAPTHAAFGFTVVITGTGFDSCSVVNINGTQAAVMALTATSITAAVPMNGTSGPIVVTNPAGKATSASLFTVDAYGPPIQINTGGTYAGNWQSLDPSIAAVTVLTSAPVIIENCRIQTASDGVQAYGGSANVTVRHCTGQALNPNVYGKQKGFFVVASNFSSLTVEHNLITGFANGADGVNYPPSSSSLTPAQWSELFTGQAVSFRFNIMHDVDGRLSDGNGGYLIDQHGSSSAFLTYFVRNANIETAWNEIINQPYVSNPEDVLSAPESRGTSTNPIDIHDNYIQGDNPSDVNYPTFSGCGIQIGDSPSKTDVGYEHVHDNQVVNFDGCGISISSGHNVEVDHNRVISAQTLADGTILNNSTNGKYCLEMVDNYWDGWILKTSPSADPYWYNNSFHDNAFNCVTASGAAGTSVFYQLGQTVIQGNNFDPLGHLATTADEVAEYARWQQKLAQNGVTIGP